MALQPIVEGPYLPPFTTAMNSAPTNAPMLLDAGDEKAAFIFSPPKDGEIDRVCFLTATVTTGALLDIRLETVDAATGAPTGTLVDTNSNATRLILATEDNTWIEVTLTAPATVLKTQRIALVIVNPVVSPGTLNIARFTNQVNNFPYNALFTGTWTLQQDAPIMAVRYDDTTYPPILGAFPCSVINQTTFASNSTPDEIGLFFRCNFNQRFAGVWAWVELDGDVDVKLYDSNGSTVLETLSFDKDIRGATSARLAVARFVTPRTFALNTDYRLTILPTTTTTCSIAMMTFAAAALMDGVPMGQTWHKTERTDAGAWTQTTTQRPFMGLILDQLDDGAGAGGGVGPQIMRAGSSGVIPVY